jgi:hypothetical protein
MDIEFPDGIAAENRKDVVKPKSNVVIAGVDNDADADKGVTSPRYNEDDSVFNSSLLGPVQFWGESPRTASLLAPSIELINFDAMADDEDDFEVVQDTKGKGRSVNRKVSLYARLVGSRALICSCRACIRLRLRLQRCRAPAVPI